MPASPGAAAVLLVRDVAGEVRSVSYLALFGEVPGEFGLQLIGGWQFDA